ncbi:carbon starvation protein A [Barrientosiimonas marina]|uniref:Carbon starvation protein A n=1 Tax=Lentibacillus kimchii TaxID=1542911 RepID=A0ABW2UZH8_9BACI
MNAIWLAAFGFIAFFVGYRYYSKFIATKIYKLDPKFKTPAHEFEDGADHVPTNKFVLWGHHFTSIAGAAPIVGPAVAVFWGWLPALLWVVVGTIFAAGVHDMGGIVLSARHKGQSVGTIAQRLIGQRAKVLFLFIILILLIMVIAVFSWVIANLFVGFPSSVLAIFIQMPIAVWIGVSVYKKKGSMLVPSLIALLVMYGAAIVANYVPALQIDLISYFGGADNDVAFGLTGHSMAFLIWIVVLMVYVYIASTMPVWKLLQPRDLINSYQLVVGLAILYLGLFFSQPNIQAPAMNGDVSTPWFPLLFVTIACGAISGFHSLVGSGTTAKQLNKEPDARFVGYLGAIGEGALALVTIIAVITGFGSEGEFLSAYTDFNTANGIGLDNFVSGAGALATGVGIPPGLAETIVSIMVVSFAATSLDTAVRLTRYIIAELGYDYKIPSLTNAHVATSIAVVLGAALALIPQGPKGFGSGGYLLWPLFGTVNQLLAGITLMLVSIWLINKGRNALPALIPMGFMLIMTIYAMTRQLLFDWMGIGGSESLDPLLAGLGALILIFTIWVIIEAIRIFFTNRPKNNDLQYYNEK